MTSGDDGISSVALRTNTAAATFPGAPARRRADAARPTHVRCDKCHAPAHFIVDHVVRLASDDAEKVATFPRSFKHGAGNIAPVLRQRPVLIEEPLAIIVAGHAFRKADDLPDIEQRYGR